MITCEIKLCLVSGLYCHKSAKSTQGLTHEVREYIWPFWSKVLVIKTNWQERPFKETKISSWEFRDWRNICRKLGKAFFLLNICGPIDPHERYTWFFFSFSPHIIQKLPERLKEISGKRIVMCGLFIGGYQFPTFFSVLIVSFKRWNFDHPTIALWPFTVPL